MKKLLIYQLITLTPIVILVSLFIYKIMDTLSFAEAFFIYALAFRPAIDFQRLKEKGIMKEGEFWKIYGSVRIRHYYQLMFEK
ncbi:MAG: hypothetical protein OJF59_001313 [Cytophagales bacterium]|nr:hypothetical protein [Bacteroidota bacterium]MBS1982340.1 hypothetical protein [Bacteroidota bacterium]WHZ07560.1 MAG: hypothetical protein OJF59_001313 [Cytophagales bacterium]